MYYSYVMRCHGTVSRLLISLLYDIPLIGSWLVLSKTKTSTSRLSIEALPYMLIRHPSNPASHTTTSHEHALSAPGRTTGRLAKCFSSALSAASIYQCEARKNLMNL
ncbi:hypothetical protein E2C01_051330 [Portunus trituberculatus]|uniref:Uncharacterized protein n=1 Tax=Portunus trituberculatus TaxID=210409 RepID=A0A5B7GBA8_PORTR|nr:hypothetical protein [Portunus trituberculatus]